MNIIFLTRYSKPDDINIWSGTLYHMHNKLKENNQIKCLGGEILEQVSYFRKENFLKEHSNNKRYLKVIGDILSERINKLNYDVVFFGDNYFVPYLKCKIPIVRISDVTFEQFKDYLNITDEQYLKEEIAIEKMALQNYTHTIYSSEWIKQKTVEYYSIDPETIDVVDFGANIPTPANYQLEIDMDICNLVFIGKRWKKKGGDKVLDAYKRLRAEGFSCTLTIIGSVPDSLQEEDQNLSIIPFLDKTKPDDLKKISDILFKSHFLVLPTEYDAYGIVFCEASAYAVPSIAADVCGVSQPIHEGKNGYLLPPSADAKDYAEKIKMTFNNKNEYLKLRASSRLEYETRLNWDVWGEQVNKILKKIVRKHLYDKTKK